MRYAFALCLSLALTAPAVAQVRDTRPGSRVPLVIPPPKKLEGDPLSLAETRQILADFAACVATRHRRKAEEVVLDGGWMPRSKSDALVDARCLNPTIDKLNKNVGLSFSRDVFGYVIAEALLKDELSGFHRKIIDQAAPLEHPTLGPNEQVPLPGKKYTSEMLAAMERARTANLASIAFVRFGECVVRADPDGARRLVGTNINSTEEGAALAALRPAMNGCVREGVQFKSNRTVMRGVVALSLYRLIKAPPISMQEAAE